MSVILSKKGLDSSFSSKPILMVDDEIVFIPIVAVEEQELKYSQVKLGNSNLLKNLKFLVGGTFYINDKKVEITKDSRCHLDPQLVNYFDSENFRGSFGQIKSAQKHLESQNVKVDDLILFYGWYKDKADKVHTDGKNVLFGYMQIDEILKVATLNEKQRKEYEKKYPWLRYQPHWKNKDKYAENDDNTIYIAKESCTFDNAIKGYGMFKYNKALDLTADDIRTKSCWKVPALAGLKTSRKGANGKDCFNERGQYRAPSRNQEIVIEDSKKAQKWAENLIKKYAKR